MLQSVKRFSGFLVMGAVFFLACESSKIAPSDSISVGLHQSGRLDSEVVVRVDSILDSRCPTGANCIWAGQATVKLLLSKNADSTTVRLSLGPDIKEGYTKRLDSTNVLLNSQPYKVILREVTPYPTVSATDQSQKAVVQVTKL